jgi:hypothetical protein
MPRVSATHVPRLRRARTTVGQSPSFKVCKLCLLVDQIVILRGLDSFLVGVWWDAMKGHQRGLERKWA